MITVFPISFSSFFQVSSVTSADTIVVIFLASILCHQSEDGSTDAFLADSRYCDM